VLDPKLQDGKKTPKFEPRSRQGLNFGWSPNMHLLCLWCLTRPLGTSTTVPIVPPASSALPPSTVVDAPLAPTDTGVPAVPTTPLQTRSLTQKIDSSRKQRENPVTEISNLPPRRSARRQPGFYRKLAGRLAMVCMAASNAPIVKMAKDVIGEPAAFVAMQCIDALTQTFVVVDYFSYKAMMSPVKGKTKKGNDPHYPTFTQAMPGPDVAEWKETLDKKITTLTKLKAGRLCPKLSQNQRARRLSRLNGSFVRSGLLMATKKKGRLCYRSDTTVSGIDSQASFSPVV
jgi:hypothetical protein